MIDVVYIVGGTALWKDNELLYSLRSLEKHVTGVNRIVVVGRKPEFLNESVIHIPCSDTSDNKAINIKNKVYKACKDNSLTKEILFMNDDYFFVGDVDARTYPYLYKCDLKHTIELMHNNYRKHCEVTLNALKLRDLPTLNFDTHKPIRYDRKKLVEIVDSYTWLNLKWGFVLKSLYCNSLKIEGQFQADNKINHPHFNWEKVIETVPDLFSIGDLSINKYFKRFLAEKYPNKSKYEN